MARPSILNLRRKLRCLLACSFRLISALIPCTLTSGRFVGVNLRSLRRQFLAGAASVSTPLTCKLCLTPINLLVPVRSRVTSGLRVVMWLMCCVCMCNLVVLSATTRLRLVGDTPRCVQLLIPS